MDYSQVRASTAEGEAYKQHFGGGASGWRKRGEFQLVLLKSLGLQPDHCLIDVGCGPLRAGRHLIDYLHPGRYCGIDYNPDFIDVACEVVRQDQDLADKHPRLEVVHGFRFDAIGSPFDFVICFSVLNHVEPADRRVFFENLPAVLRKGSKVLLSHADWLSPEQLPEGMEAAFIPQLTGELDPSRWGWSDTAKLFPFVELTALR